VTREEFEKKVEAQRKYDLMELQGRLEAEDLAKTTFNQRATERSTGRRALQAAAAIRIETDTEQSLAKVAYLVSSLFIQSIYASACSYCKILFYCTR